MIRTRLFLFSITTLMSFTTLMAQQVSIIEAISTAKSFIQSSTIRRGSTENNETMPQLQLSYTCNSTTSDDVCFYVFNIGTKEGFIIVGGDKVAREILGFANTGYFDYASVPENMKRWLSLYQSQITYGISYAKANPKAVSEAITKTKAARKMANKVDISPLIQTQWNQTAPYNNAIPSLGDNREPFVTGCVATAMAQVMKHYNYPAKGVGIKSYSKKLVNLGKFNFSANFGKTTYDWSKMTNTYGKESTETEKKAVATLMYHCGVAVNMIYGQSSTGGSSASSENAATALCSTFRYNKAIRMEYRKFYTDVEWELLIYNELSKNRPIIYSDQSTTGGHVFICDGYHASENTYHMNWGWGGFYDCYVAMTGTDAIESNGSGIDGDSGFNQDHDAIINIIAKEGGIEQPHLVSIGNGNITLNVEDTVYSAYSYTKSKKPTLAKLYTSIRNRCTTLTSFTIGVRAYDKSTGIVKYWMSKDINNLPIGSYFTSKIPLVFDMKDFVYNGTYELQPVCRLTNSKRDKDWVLIDVTPTDQLPTIIVTGAKEPPVARK